VEPQLVRYPSFDGLMIPAWFYPARASESGRLPPVIVYPHGGPESQTRPEFSAIFQYFLQAGYAIFAPNVRGSSGYGMHYMNLDNTTRRMDSVKDLIWGVYWLRDQKKADPKRIAGLRWQLWRIYGAVGRDSISGLIRRRHQRRRHR
jgi:dipeptidyl aminopeptidase/acylaminoacyl peptidase